MRCMTILSILLCLQSSTTLAFSSDLTGQRKPIQYNRLPVTRVCQLHMSNDEDASTSHFLQRREPGRKRAILRKYTKAIALSTTLLYGPMASAPPARRFIGSTAHAASTVAPSKNDYNFQDFKDVKKKLSLAPGANVEKYEEILDKVAVEGDAALKDMKPGDLEAALTLGGTDEVYSDVSGSAGRSKARAQKKQNKKQSKKQEVSEWESDEFGFGDDDEDELGGVMTMGTSASSKQVKGRRNSGADKDSSKGDVVMTDKMAFNNYQEVLGKSDHMKTIKKLSFYSIFPIFVITMIRGQVRAYREKKKVKRGLALFEQEKKDYEEEMKNKRNNKGGDDDDDDDDDDDY